MTDQKNKKNHRRKIHQTKPRERKAMGFYFFAKLVLGIITLLLLGLLLVKLFSIALESNDRKRAQETIRQLQLAMENAKSEAFVRHLILAPKNWYLLSYDSKELEDICKEGKCLCMCEKDKFSKVDKQIRACLGKAEGICETSPASIKNSENANFAELISKVPHALTIRYFKDKETFHFYNFDIFNFDKNDIFDDDEAFARYYVEGGPETPGALFEKYSAVAIRDRIQSNENADALLLWNSVEYTNFAEILGKESDEKNINPLLILAMLKVKHQIFETFQAKGNEESSKPRAAQIMRESVFERAKQLLIEEDFNRECKRPSISEREANKERFNKEITSAVQCLAGTLKTAIDKGDKYNIYEKTGGGFWSAVKRTVLPVNVAGEKIDVKDIETAAIYWYAGDASTIREIWEVFNFYTK